MSRLWLLRGAHEAPGWQSLRTDQEEDRVEMVHIDPEGVGHSAGRRTANHLRRRRGGGAAGRPLSGSERIPALPCGRRTGGFSGRCHSNPR